MIGDVRGALGLVTNRSGVLFGIDEHSHAVGVGRVVGVGSWSTRSCIPRALGTLTSRGR